MRYIFTPTQHDPLAQAPGRFSYFIDEEGEWWRCLWERELYDEEFDQNEKETYIKINNELVLDLRTIHRQNLPNGKYKIELSFTEDEVPVRLEILEGDKILIQTKEKEFEFQSVSEDLKLRVVVGDKKIGLKSIVISPV